MLDQNGGSSFAALQDALSRGDTKSMRYIVFDLLYRDGEDWRGAKLTDRKDALRDLLKNTRGPLVYSDHVVAHGSEVFKQACDLTLEGVISKRARPALLRRPHARLAQDQMHHAPGIRHHRLCR